uniref:hypothetical protein n=1 Tax=Roseivirga sp. TaxID=1964215 RepID=UPI004047693F
MDLETRNIQLYIDKEVAAFEAEASKLIAANAKRFSYSGELANTIKLTVQKSKDDFGYEITAFFGDRGKMLEQKEVFAKKAPISVLEDWIKYVGLQNFSFVPNSEKRGELSIDERANRIAWGIKISENQYRFGQQGGTVSKKAIGLKSTKRSQQVSWFYRPYFGLWAKYRQRIFDAYFDNLAPALADLVEQELNKVSVS